MPFFSRGRWAPSVITRADRARGAGQWQLAAGLYRRALNRNPNNPPIWVQYGHALKECGKRAEAETAYRTAISYRPDDADAHLHLGHLLKLQGRTTEARAAYRQALALDASLSEAARELRLEHEEDGQPTEQGAPAQVAKTQVAKTGGPERRRPFQRGNRRLIQRAERAREARQWDVVADCYRRALDRNPGNAPVWAQYGHALKQSGDLARAERAYRAAILRDPDAADSYLQLGHVLKLLEKPEEARTASLRALARDPSLSEARDELRELGWSDGQIGELRRLTAQLPRGERQQPLAGEH